MDITIKEMTQILGIAHVSVMARLRKAGIKPYKYIGHCGIYTQADFNAIKKVRPPGRPPIDPP
jgi:hypothetical protein